ncbi:MAG: type II and III secretion system protein family protein [Planctomycetes bacterium]|nr:type II and III secretion system protein family protein [Planctomycetota bacterium]
MTRNQGASILDRLARRTGCRTHAIGARCQALAALSVGMLAWNMGGTVRADEPAAWPGHGPVTVAANKPVALQDEPAADSQGGAAATPENKPAVAPKGSLTEAPAISADAFIESVRVDKENADRILVSRNSTAIINLRQKADGVQIADPNIADYYLTSPTRIVVSGKSYGTTQLLIRFGEQQKTFNIDVELDMSALHAFIASNAPTAHIEARSVNGVIMLTGTVPDADTAQRISGMAALVQGGEVRSNLTVAGVQQTMLRVVVAEVNKEASRQLGVNWAIGASDWSRDFFFANNVANINPTVFGSSGLADVLTGQQLYGVAGVGNGANTNITFGFPKAEFQVFLNALRENGLARTLAEPNLVAISGQTATFLAGGEVPIPVAQAGASAGAITVEYREFGVRLGFTPAILSGQIIRLHVMSEVSEAIPTTTVVGGFPLFTFTTRRVESTIECGNGQTFAIAGLLNDRIRANSSKIPGLGDLPVLGTMFSSTAYERSMTELVVLVTPQLVEPLDPQQVPPPPGSLMTEPTDFELFGLQKLEGEPLARSESDGVPREQFPVKTQPGGTSRWPTSAFALRGPWGLAEFEEK